MSEGTLFEKIADGTIPSRKVWEDEKYLAFLTPCPNTPGMTLVVPKKNPGAYVFDMPDEEVASLMSAAKKVAKLLEKAFGLERVAVVFEGEAVPHVHAKLYPMHNMSDDRSAFPKQQPFFPVYPGYIQTSDGPQMSDEELDSIQEKIKEASNEN
jgi:diadenosine tetraphosphate (Ap4A) HIT family hydrolase